MKSLLIDIVMDYPPGYPQMAAFMYSAETFHIVRRFGRLRMRQLLYYQCELRRLESSLTALDDEDHGNKNGVLHSTAVENDRGRQPPSKRRPREKIMDSIDDKLAKYGQ